jgi:predicted membrane-bound spermidine synthase
MDTTSIRLYVLLATVVLLGGMSIVAGRLNLSLVVTPLAAAIAALIAIIGVLLGAPDKAKNPPPTQPPS